MAKLALSAHHPTADYSGSPALRMLLGGVVIDAVAYGWERIYSSRSRRSALETHAACLTSDALC